MARELFEKIDSRSLHPSLSQAGVAELMYNLPDQLAQLGQDCSTTSVMEALEQRSWMDRPRELLDFITSRMYGVRPRINPNIHAVAFWWGIRPNMVGVGGYQARGVAVKGSDRGNPDVLYTIAGGWHSAVVTHNTRHAGEPRPPLRDELVVALKEAFSVRVNLDKPNISSRPEYQGLLDSGRSGISVRRI